MEKLTMFGMPIVFSTEDQKLKAEDKNVNYEDYSRKYSKGMFGLLADNSYLKEEEPYYDFYKAIVDDSVRARFSDANLRYDSTVIMEGCAGNEFKKTAGHFHCLIPGKTVSYPELYQVIKGTALFVMQRVNDNTTTDGNMVVQDSILAEVHAGESIVVPPDFGHCTVNIGSETMVFVNLVSCDSHNSYESVKSSAGMCCYVLRYPDGSYRIEKNPHYDFACQPRIVVPTDSPTLGISKNVPVYTSFLNAPETYRYLNDPEGLMSDYFSMLKDKE